jgi:hypothetical protein
MKIKNNIYEISRVVLLIWFIIAIVLMILSTVIDYLLNDLENNFTRSNLPTYLFITSSILLTITILGLAGIKIFKPDD